MQKTATWLVEGVQVETPLFKTIKASLKVGLDGLLSLKKGVMSVFKVISSRGK